MDTKNLFSNCYTPYSGEDSIAVAQSREGRYYAGVRVENIVYPLTITAAQSAIFSCLSEGDQPSVLLVSGNDDTQLPFWTREYNMQVKKLTGKVQSEISVENLIVSPKVQIETFLPTLLGNAVTVQSDFPVSAVLETDIGRVSGVNIECSAWNMGICAERIAIAKAISNGAKKILSIHIHTRDGEFSSPCGACRQVILEHLPRGQVHLYHADRSKSSYFSRDLLPYSFYSTTLKKQAADPDSHKF